MIDNILHNVILHENRYDAIEYALWQRLCELNAECIDAKSTEENCND